MSTSPKVSFEDLVVLIQDHFLEERHRLLADNLSEEFADKVIKNCIEFTITFYTATSSFVLPVVYKENAGQVNIIYMSDEKYFQFETTSEEKPRIVSANMLASFNSEAKLASGGDRESLVAFAHYMNRPDVAMCARKIWRH